MCAPPRFCTQLWALQRYFCLFVILNGLESTTLKPIYWFWASGARIDNLLSQVIYVFQIIIVLFGVVGLGWGYTIQQFSQTVRMQLSKCLLISFVTFEGSPSLKPSQVYILGAGLVLASLLTIPPWGIYRLGHNHLPLYI